MNRETSFSSSDTLVVVDRSRRQRIIAIGVGIALVAAILIGALIFMRGGGTAGAGANESRGGQVPSVTVMVPGREEVARTVTASGALAARRDQPVGIPGEGGQITRVYVDAGAWVKQGQILASIERSVQSQEAAQLAAQVRVARADAALAQNEYERAQSLVARGFVSKADLDRKQAARDAANARVQVSQAQFNASRARLGRLDVRAPDNGLILARNIEVGQIVSPGSGALFRLASGGDMEMRAEISQQDLTSVRVGMPATITPIGTTQTIQGSVWQVSPVINPQSRLGEVRIAIPYTPSVRPGGFAEAKIVAGATTAPVLPQSAVLSDSKGNYVYVVNSQNVAERRAIRTGSVTAAGVTIASGLTGQETIVVTAGPFLNPGQKVLPRRQASQ